MATSQNNYLVLMTNRTTGPLPRLRHWDIAGTGRAVYLRDGSAGFLLAHIAHWFDENIEKIGSGVYDDWGWAVRPIRGQNSGYSNHASGTAIDLNATKHPRGRSASATFSQAEIDRIHHQLEAYEGCIRWGGDYHNTPDGMHFEINDSLGHVQKVARDLWQSKHGKPIIAANPGAASVIWDGRVPGEKPPPPKPTKERLAADWSYAKDSIDAKAVQAAGIRGVGRYFSGDPAKDIDNAERVRLHANGLWVLPFFEKKARRAAEGKVAGRLDQASADAQGDSLGWPREDAVFLTVDFDAKFGEIRDYFEGANESNKRPVGVYGSGQIVDDVMNAGLAKYGIEAASRAWGGGHRSTRASLLQRTTHSVTIKGSKASDWDELVILPGRAVIPVWNPGEPAWKPTPPARKPSSTKLNLVGKPVVKPHETSDHRPVLWNLRMDSGETFWRGHWNLQGTDPTREVEALIHEALDEASIWVFNEVTTLALQNFLHTLRLKGKINAYLPGVKLSADGMRVIGASPAAAVPIVWRRDTWHAVKRYSTRIAKGARGFSPHRYANRVLFESLATGERHRELGTHWVHAIEKDGRARRLTLPGQIQRGKDCSAGTVKALKSDTAEVVDAMTYPVFGSGDLNVDYNADRTQVLGGNGTPWFPYTAIRAVAYCDLFNNHRPTHGSRLIDQGFLSPAK